LPEQAATDAGRGMALNLGNHCPLTLLRHLPKFRKMKLVSLPCATVMLYEIVLILTDMKAMSE